MDKIICIGKNYPAHAAELGDKQPEQPVLFLKPPSSLRQLSSANITIHLPPGDIHHELEVVFRLNTNPEGSKGLFSEFTLGLDLTRRDLQSNLKKNGHPWEIAKVFTDSAIVGPWFKWGEWDKHWKNEFSLEVNGQCRQVGKVQQMLWSAERCLDLAAQYFPILPGDLLFTGTPTGVGPLHSGDCLQMKWGATCVGPEIKIIEH